MTVLQYCDANNTLDAQQIQVMLRIYNVFCITELQHCHHYLEHNLQIIKKMKFYLQSHQHQKYYHASVHYLNPYLYFSLQVIWKNLVIMKTRRESTLGTMKKKEWKRRMKRFHVHGSKVSFVMLRFKWKYTRGMWVNTIIEYHIILYNMILYYIILY